MAFFHISYEFILILDAFTRGAVNCYALISGYVGYARKVKYSNIMNLTLTVIFYTVSLPLLMKLLFDVPFSKSDMILSFFSTFLFTDIADIKYGYTFLRLAAVYMIDACIKK